MINLICEHFTETLSFAINVQAIMRVDLDVLAFLTRKYTIGSYLDDFEISTARGLNQKMRKVSVYKYCPTNLISIIIVDVRFYDTDCINYPTSTFDCLQNAFKAGFFNI